MSSARPRILFAWELGANFGHASNVAEVARALGDRADAVVVAKDPVSFRKISPDVAVELLPAPRAQPRPPPTQQELGRSFSDDLRNVGWGDAGELTALLESWNAIIRLVKPDIIAMQAAPTAALAAHGGAAKTALFGYGYDLPPRISPLPPFYYWTENAAAGLDQREAAVLANANTARAAFDQPGFDRFADILQTDSYMIGCYPEIDPYNPRSQFEAERPLYYGQLATTDVGQDVRWRDKADHRLFAYLQPSHAATKTALEGFASLGPEWDCIVSAPSLPQPVLTAMQRPHLRIIGGPVRLDRILRDCHVAVTHGGGGTLGAFLAAGVPQVCLPTHAEQIMAARALATQGLAFGMLGKFGPAEVRQTVERVIATPQMRTGARAAAKRLKQQNLLEPAKRIAAELLRLA